MPRKGIRTQILLTIASVASSGCFTECRAGEQVFRAGAFVADISPRKLPVLVSGGFLEARAEKVQDPLHARCLVLDDGSVRAAIAIVDTLMMPRDLIEKAKGLARERTGIPEYRMTIAATHTHSAPSVMGALGTGLDEEYSRDLPVRIAEGLEGAARRLAPARIGWAAARDPRDTQCRRWIKRPDRIGTDPFGEATVRAMMHPGYRNPDYLGPAGPAEDGITVLSVATPDGRPLALLANYSMHYVGAAPVSADYFGAFAEKIRELLGAGKADPPFVGILSQGTAGDQHWMDYGEEEVKGVDRFKIAESLAKVVVEAWKGIEHRSWAPIAVAERRLALRVRTPDEKRLRWATPIAEKLGDRPPRTIEEVYAREQLLLAASPERELVLQSLRIGDLGIAAIPAEVFGITGLKIKAMSPLVPTFTLELANGAEGYIPPPAQHRLGGYTTWPARTACLEVEAEPKIVEAVLGLLEEVSGKPRRKPVVRSCPYSRSVLASKPAAYFRLDEFEGPEARDLTGNGNRMSFDGGIAFYLEGPVSAGFASDGGDGSLNRAPHLAGGRLKAAVKGLGAAWSIELWFWSGLPADAREVTGELFSRGSERLSIGGTARAPGRLFFTAGGASGCVLEGRTAIEPRTWNHLVFVRDGGRIAVYLNVKREPEISGPAPAEGLEGLEELSFGGSSDSRFTFEGKIDEVAVYGRALTADEAAAHFGAPGGG